jgi:hypothetical protein
LRKRLFEASKEGLGGVFLIIISIFGEDFGKSLWKFWRAMKKKLWE